MPAPRWVARFNREVTNRIARPLAPRAPGFGIVIHRGRKSRRLYRTPVNVFPRPGGFVIALTYGSGSDWVRNVLAADGCTLETRGRTYTLVSPRLLQDDRALGVPQPFRFVLRRAHVWEFLDLSCSDAGASAPRPETANAGASDRRELSETVLTTTCCIAGCGPAGAVLGLLLARAGVDVVVLEKHGDFLRDFRGDTIHPSTLELLDQLGLAERFLQLPHTITSVMRIRTDAGQEIAIEFGRLPTRFPYLAFVPQWDFLDFLTAEASRYPAFHLKMQSEVLDLIEDRGVVRGVRYRSGGEEGEVRASLVVGADGRGSRTREVAGLPRVSSAAAFDVLWFRLPVRADDPDETLGRIGVGHFIAAFKRRDYWQVAFSIPKGDEARVRAEGLEKFRSTVGSYVPLFADRTGELHEWDEVKLLSVRADRLERWCRPGYLAIGDAAHAMSPVAGVGINVAIQDAVAAANVLWKPLLDGTLSIRDLAHVQQQRELSVRVIQGVQAIVQRIIIQRVVREGRSIRVPAFLTLALEVPVLRDIPGSLVAFGVRRPRVQAPRLAKRRS